MKRYICFLLILLLTLASRAQLGFQFIPEVQGRTVDGLLQVRIINPSGDARAVNLTARVSARGSGEVFRLSMAGIPLAGGVNALPYTLSSKAVVRFADNPTAAIIRQSNVLPEGSYEYCFTLEEANKPSGTAVLAEECFDYELEALSPLSLLEPYHTEQLCTTKPTLVWQPVFPAISGLLYQLTLCEVKQGQAPAEALYVNTPLINQRNLQTPFLPYPSIARDLDTGKTYVWQVAAYRGDLIISRSEVWTFQVGCRETLPAVPRDGFRSIDDLVMGNYYIANGAVLFALHNPYAEMKLRYSIASLSHPGEKIKGLAPVTLKKGSNHVVIDLRESPSFKDGQVYVLKIRMPGGDEKQLRFIYRATE